MEAAGGTSCMENPTSLMQAMVGWTKQWWGGGGVVVGWWGGGGVDYGCNYAL